MEMNVVAVIEMINLAKEMKKLEVRRYSINNWTRNKK